VATKKTKPAKTATTTKRKKKEGTPATETAVQRTAEQARFALRRMERNFYDIQRLRLQAGGRNLRKGPDSQIQLYEVDLAAIERRTSELAAVEKGVLSDIQDLLDTMPFYVDVLSKKPDYKGIGPTMAAVILSEFDFARQETPSQAWAFAGLAPINARRCKACQGLLDPAEHDMYKHRPTRPRRGPVEAEADSKAKPTKCKLADAFLTDAQTFASGESMRPVRGEKLRYNAFLRAKMVGVLAEVLIKVKSPWTKFYYDYKHRKQTAGWGKSDGHRDFASKRYMIKMLLLDIWTKFRTYHGLPVRQSYQEQYQQHTHHAAPQSAPAHVVDEPFVDPSVQAELEQASL
jgi:Transposase IS116/IS110/IS902 family